MPSTLVSQSRGILSAASSLGYGLITTTPHGTFWLFLRGELSWDNMLERGHRPFSADSAADMHLRPCGYTRSEVFSPFLLHLSSRTPSF